MPNNSSLIETAPVTTTRTLANHPVIAFWHTMIGKKVVMAITGIILIGFVIADMLGNLKVFSRPGQIDAYSRFLREIGFPALAYGELLWAVRIVLLTCVARSEGWFCCSPGATSGPLTETDIPSTRVAADLSTGHFGRREELRKSITWGWKQSCSCRRQDAN